MIEELRIRDLGVINDAVVTPHRGLTVVTGETGAGKTMVVTGIGLLLGDRTNAGVVRSGAARCVVEGRLLIGDPALVARVREAGGELDGGEVEVGEIGAAAGETSTEDGELVVARHVTATGRSRAFMGGAQVPVAVCAGVTTELVAIHGQSEQVRLAASDRQRELLDAYGGVELAALLARYRQQWREHRVASDELAGLMAAAQTRAQEVERLRFGLEEIERVAPEPAEDVALAAEANRLQSADDLRAAAASALAHLAGTDDDVADATGGATGLLAAARHALEHGPEDPELAALAARVAELAYLTVDAGSDLARYLDGLDAEPARLEWIAARRSQLAGLTRRYGTSVDEVLAWSAAAAQQLVTLERSDDRIADLTRELAASDVQLRTLAAEITQARGAAATSFATAVQGELSALAMPHARLVFVVEEADLGPHGADDVELRLSANPGSAPAALGKVASGGELSRVRLALEVVLAARRSERTLVFDEVDAGVGGKVAVEIGRRLAALAQHCQVIVVTHLAQVAAFADRHLVVVKADDGQVTTSGVVQLAESERAAELARMMAGLDTTESALAHAGELVELATAARSGRAGSPATQTASSEPVSASLP